MEIQLSELIEQIKKDGVAVAENQSNAIVDSAKKEAEESLRRIKQRIEASSAF